MVNSFPVSRKINDSLPFLTIVATFINFLTISVQGFNLLHGWWYSFIDDAEDCNTLHRGCLTL